MSSIAIPKHWRFNYPLLMGHLKKGPGGHLLRNANEHLVKNCTGETGACCDYAPPMSVTFSGATGCASVLNGTFALSFNVGCTYVYDELLTIPASPCGSSACFIQTVSGRSRWWHPYRIGIDVILSNVDLSIEVSVALDFLPYYLVSGSCNVEVILGLSGNSAIFERETCLSGSMARTFNAVQSAAGSPANPDTCTVAF